MSTITNTHVSDLKDLSPEIRERLCDGKRFRLKEWDAFTYTERMLIHAALEEEGLVAKVTEYCVEIQPSFAGLPEIRPSYVEPHFAIHSKDTRVRHAHDIEFRVLNASTDEQAAKMIDEFLQDLTRLGYVTIPEE